MVGGAGDPGPSFVTHHPELLVGAGPWGDGAAQGSLREHSASAEVTGRGASCGLVTPAAPQRCELETVKQEEPVRGEGVCPPGCGLPSRAESRGPGVRQGVTPRTDAFFHPCHDGLQKRFAFPRRIRV